VTTIYHAEGCSEDRNFHIGYFTGNYDDICVYIRANYNLGYGLELEKIVIKDIPPFYAEKHAELARQRAELKKKLDELDKEIKQL